MHAIHIVFRDRLITREIYRWSFVRSFLLCIADLACFAAGLWSMHLLLDLAIHALRLVFYMNIPNQVHLSLSDDSLSLPIKSWCRASLMQAVVETTKNMSDRLLRLQDTNLAPGNEIQQYLHYTAMSGTYNWNYLIIKVNDKVWVHCIWFSLSHSSPSKFNVGSWLCVLGGS